MYLYFNNQGVLKEIVNDDAIRQGNHNINKIRFFIEGAEPQIVNNVYKAITFVTGVRTFIDVNGNQLTTESISLSTEELEIPYNKKRELKFFKYFTKYEMFSITIPDDILNESGTVGCRVQMVSAEGIITLGLIVFNVEITTGGQAIIEPDTAINIAQWNYLISNMLTPEKYVVKYDTDANQWDIVPTEGSTKPITSGGVATAIANALSTVYKIQGNATISELNGLEKSEAMNGYVYNMSDAGTLINEDQWEVSVQEGDNVVFVWNDGEWYWDRLGSIFDTSNLVTTNTQQTITAPKIFSAPSKLDSIIAPSDKNLVIYRSDGTIPAFIFGNYDGISKSNYSISPTSNNTLNLGSATLTWKDLHLSGTQYFYSSTNNGEDWNIKNTNGTLYYERTNLSYSLAIGGAAVSSINLIPKSPNSYSLGGSEAQWKDLYLSGKIYLDESGNYTISKDVNTIRIDANGNAIGVKGPLRPTATSSYDLGTPTLSWKDLYLSGQIQSTGSLGLFGYVGTNTTGFTLGNGIIQANRNLAATTNETRDLGSSSIRWLTTYTKNISDGTNNIAVADIAKKTDPTNNYDVGAFDSNGEITVDIGTFEQDIELLGWGQTLYGMYMLTYSYAQAIVYLDKDQLDTAGNNGIPIRTAMPVVYNATGSAEPGNLRVQKVGTNYVFKVSNGVHNAYAGLHLIMIKTDLVK